MAALGELGALLERSENVSGSVNVSASGWHSGRRSTGGTRAEGAKC